jgi:spore maturation protein SpmA
MADQVSQSQGLMDGIQSAVRYAVVLVGFTTAVLGLLKVHDIAGIIALIQSNGGTVLAAISGLIALGTAAYGVLKSQKRGTQVAEAAAVPQVKTLELK